MIEIEFAPRRSDADYWSGRRADGDGADEGAGEGQAAAIIPVPSGARVWLAAGHTDMRKGNLMDWRSWFRRRCGVIRMAGTCSSFGAGAVASR